MDRGSGRAQKCHQVVPRPKGGVLQCDGVIHPSPPNSLWTFIVGFTVSCAAASTFSQGCCNPVSAVFHNLILLLGFEQLFGAVHVWLVGDSPAGASAVPLM